MGSRNPIHSIQFKEAYGLNGKYAIGWFFLVHTAFKSALDISHSTWMDEVKTLALRDRKCIEFTGKTHRQYKEGLRIAGINLTEDGNHNEVMSYKIQRLIETEGNPPMLSFKKSDSLDSRCGMWSIQVEQANPDQDKKFGNVGFTIYRAKPHSNSNGIWEKYKWMATSQSEFVELLRLGKCSSIDLNSEMLI